MPRIRRRYVIAPVAFIIIIGSHYLLSFYGNRARAKEECRLQLGSIALALVTYESVHHSFPSGTVPNDRLTPEHRLSWYFDIIYYIQAWSAPLSVNSDEAWDSAANRSLVWNGIDKVDGTKRMHSANLMNIFMCPMEREGRTTDHPSITNYIGIAGLGADAPILPPGHPRAGIFGYDRRTKVADVTDGLSTTMMVAESARDNGWWTAGGPATVRGVDPADRPQIGKGRPFGGLHEGGAMVCFADGSVRFVRSTIAPEVFEALTTIAGGEKITGDDLAKATESVSQNRGR